jgi:MinD-like ATPase involved in chromosome partitioning or flagellar assembly
VSDVLLIMLRPDQQDFQGTGVTVEVAHKLDVPKLLLLVNKVLPELDAHEIRQQVESTYNVKVAGVLPLTEDMVRLASGGLFIQHYPDHPWSQELRALADEIMG